MSIHFRTHPATILVGLKRYVFILLFPVLQQLLTLPFHPSSWSVLFWGEIGAAGAIVLLSAVRWLLLRCRLVDGVLTVSSGVLLQKRRAFPLSAVSSVNYERPLWLAAMGGGRVRLDTAAGRDKEADLTLYVSRKRADWLVSQIKCDYSTGKTARGRAGLLPLMLMAASSSNAAAGLFFAVPLINHLGEILGEEFSRRIYETFNRATEILSQVIPPLTAGIAVILAAGWLIAFFRVLIRYMHLQVRRSGSVLTLTAGPFFQRHTVLPIDHINAVDIRQKLLMYPFGVRSICLLCAGFGKEKGEREVLLPAMRPEPMEQAMKSLLPGFHIQPKNFVRPPKKALRRYVFIPVLILLLLSPAILLLWAYRPSLRFLIPWLAIALMLPAVWFLLLSLASYKEAGVDLNSDICILRCRKYFVLHWVAVPATRIRRIDLTQSIFQRMDGVCNLRVLIYGEKGTRYTIRELPLEEVLQSVSEFDYS